MSENENNDQSESLKFDLEVAPIESITKAEIDVQIATAHAYPRSLKLFYQRAEAMVTMDEETAESCLYTLTRKDKRTGKINVIEGESIRMAEIVAACYGNMRSAVHISGHTPTRVSVRAVAHDLETNNLIAVEKQAKTAYSNGEPYNEDMAITVANATVSKALRDAIFRVVPKALVKPLKEKAKQIALGQAGTVKARREKALKWIETLGIDKARVWTVLGIKGEEEIMIEQLGILTGLKTAIKDGEQTVDEAFPAPDFQKPIFTHPEQQKRQEEQKKETQAETKKEAPPTQTQTQTPGPTKTAELKTIAAEIVKETKPEPPKTEAAPKVDNPAAALAQIIAQQKSDQVQTAAPTATDQPEKTDAQVEADMGLAPSNVVPMEEPKTPPPLSESQAKFKALLEGASYTLADFYEWGKTAINMKTEPKLFSDISDKNSTYFCGQFNGIKTAMDKKYKRAKK